jgi:hypothetical protein
MIKIEEVLSITPIEKVLTIPHSICEIMVVNVDDYHVFMDSDKEKKDQIDQQMFNFKKSQEYIGFYNKIGTKESPITYKIFIKSTWNSKRICERKIIEYLR